jgi:IS66 Orf2 like protein
MIQIAPSVRIYLACRPVDMRRGFDGLSADVVQALKGDPYSGAVFVFRGKRGQPTTFCIRFSVCDDCLSLASVVWTNVAGLSIPTRQGIDVHLYARATRSLS